MHDWMISKKRYWGLALPIYDCAACGTFDVVGGRDELAVRAVEGWDQLEGHTAPPALRRRGHDRLPDLRRPRLADPGRRATRGSTPGSCRSPRSTTGRIRPTGRDWFPADFVTESFPGQFRNWFYSMLAMSTVLRREAPFKTIFGYATLFGEDGRPMHKSWGNAIEFDEAAERMGVDVMRWMYANARPDDNILFGWHAADEARRELLVLWNVYAFFVTYARLAGWSPGADAATRTGPGERGRRARRSTAGSSRAWPASPHGSRIAWPTTTPTPPRARSPASSTSCPPGTCGRAGSASRARTTRPTATRPSPRCTRR